MTFGKKEVIFDVLFFVFIAISLLLYSSSTTEYIPERLITKIGSSILVFPIFFSVILLTRDITLGKKQILTFLKLFVISFAVSFIIYNGIVAPIGPDANFHILYDEVLSKEILMTKNLPQNFIYPHGYNYHLLNYLISKFSGLSFWEIQKIGFFISPILLGLISFLICSRLFNAKAGFFAFLLSIFILNYNFFTYPENLGLLLILLSTLFIIESLYFKRKIFLLPALITLFFSIFLHILTPIIILSVGLLLTLSKYSNNQISITREKGLLLTIGVISVVLLALLVLVTPVFERAFLEIITGKGSAIERVVPRGIEYVLEKFAYFIIPSVVSIGGLLLILVQKINSKEKLVDAEKFLFLATASFFAIGFLSLFTAVIDSTRFFKYLSVLNIMVLAFVLSGVSIKLTKVLFPITLLVILFSVYPVYQYYPNANNYHYVYTTEEVSAIVWANLKYPDSKILGDQLYEGFIMNYSDKFYGWSQRRASSEIYPSTDAEFVKSKLKYYGFNMIFVTENMKKYGFLFGDDESPTIIEEETLEEHSNNSYLSKVYSNGKSILYRGGN